jgi:hypothetical protein
MGSLKVTVTATGGLGTLSNSFVQNGNLLDVTVVDEVGTTKVSQVNLDSISPIVIDILTFEVTGENEATITAIASGGFGDLTYSLYDGATFIESNLTGLFIVTEAKTYTVKVNDEGGASEVSGTIDVVIEQGIPFAEDLVFTELSRTGNELIDGDSVKQAEILTPFFLQSASATSSFNGDKTRLAEKIFDGNSYTFYFRFQQLVAANPSLNNQPLLVLGSNSSSRRGIRLYSYQNRLSMLCSDGTTNKDVSSLVSMNANFDNGGIYDAVIHVNFDTKRVDLNIYNASGGLIGGINNVDISLFTFNANENFMAYSFLSKLITVYNFKKYTGIVSLSNSITDTYVTGLQMHYSSIWDQVDISGNGNDLAIISVTNADKIYLSINEWGLKYGGDTYVYPATNVLFHVTKRADGSKNAPNITAGSPLVSTRIIWESPANEMLNIRDSKIRFANAFFDRSNATIWGNNARLGLYDVNNPRDFHFTELNQRTLQAWLNDGYRGRLAVHFEGNSVEQWDRNNLLGIYLYNTDKKGNNHKKILEYTNDYSCAVTDNNNPVLDNDGYVRLGYLQATKPMLLMRFDDGYLDLLTSWKSVMDNLNVKPIVGIHAGQMGEMSDQSQLYLSWAELKQLTDEGWGIADHNYTDIDYSLLVNLPLIDGQMQDSIAAALIEGYILQHYIGNRHSSSNPSVQWYCKKNGYKTHFTWNIYGEGDAEGANPLNLNLLRMRSIAADINSPGNFNIDVTPNAVPLANIKAEIDIAATDNRIVVPFVHAYSVRKRDAIIEVINYARSQNVEVVDIVEMMNNLKYL